MDLLSLVTAAVVSLAPQLPPETAERYASDITRAADDDLELALALVVTQDAESSWRKAVETCEVTGDGGLAITAFQLHKHWLGGYGRRDVCASNALAASLAASALVALAHRTGAMRDAIRAYVGCRPKDPRHVRRIQNFNRLLPILLAMARDAEAS